MNQKEGVITVPLHLKTSMLRSSLCYYSDVYILFKGTLTVENMADSDVAGNNTNKKVIFKSWAPFADNITEINNTQVDHAKKIDIVMSMYYSIECSDAYSKTSGSLRQYYRDEPALNAAGVIIDFTANNNNNNNNSI